MLTLENFEHGFLVDDEVLGGVTLHPENDSEYVAFVLLQSTGESISYETFSNPQDAIASINALERTWIFEKAHQGCGGGSCGEGECGGGGCGGGGCSTNEGSCC